MKKFFSNAGAFLLGFLIFGGLFVLSLQINVDGINIALWGGNIALFLFIMGSVKTKSLKMMILGFIFSIAIFYITWLFNMGITWLIYIASNGWALLGKILNNIEEAIINEAQWLPKWIAQHIHYILVSIMVLAIYLVLKKAVTKLLALMWNLFKKVWNFLSELYVIVPNDEAHVVTRINGNINVYSGKDIRDRSKSLKKAYDGNHYWNFEKIKFLKIIFGIEIQKVPFDDLKAEIKNVDNLKSKDDGELTIGEAVFHFQVLDPIIASEVWPGKDMNPQTFITQIDDIVREAVEITIKEFNIEDLIGGSKIVNQKFKEELAEKLEKNYGIIIINAKLSKESGEPIDLILQKRNEELRRDAEIKKHQADTEIKKAEIIKQQSINNLMLTSAQGEKKVIEINASAEAQRIEITSEAEAQRIKKVLTAQASQKDIMLATNPIAAKIEIAKALAKLYANATTIVNGGGSSDLIGIILAISKTLGIGEKALEEINNG